MTMRLASSKGPSLTGENRSVSGTVISKLKSDLKLTLCLFGSFVFACAGCATRLQEEPPSAAARNAASLHALPIDLFGRTEVGWAVYAPRIEQTVGARSGPATAAFAAAVARWRVAHALGDTGVVDATLLSVMKQTWQAERPFLALRAAGVCPPPPPEANLAWTLPAESHGGRVVQLRHGALDAWRALVREARYDQPALAAHPELLVVFSGYRSPEHDAVRCAQERNCQGVVRAACSAHRTGLALDVVLDTAPGYAVDSTADRNREAMADGLAYRWLVANAARFGFVNYVFEPWHWEWTGERP